MTKLGDLEYYSILDILDGSFPKYLVGKYVYPVWTPRQDALLNAFELLSFNEHGFETSFATSSGYCRTPFIAYDPEYRIPITMTLKEVEAALGYKVKLI